MFYGRSCIYFGVNQTVITGLIAGALSISGCCGPKFHSLSVSSPKAYDDSTVLKMFCNQNKELQEMADNLKANNQLVNEIHLLKERKKFFAKGSIAYSGIAKSSDTTTSETESFTDTSSSPAELSPDTSANQASLPFSARLRKTINEQEELYGYMLHYLGDADLRSSDKRVILIRFDVSLNEYMKADSLSFDYVTFTFKTDQKKFRIYYVGPEYSSVVAEEQLANALIKNYSGEIAARYANANVHMEGRLNRDQLENMEYLLERPMKFAVYDNPYTYKDVPEDKSVTFAFGPRRNIFKRSWYNPSTM